MSPKRKELIREQATNIGSIDTCPYCDSKLDKIPKRKAKCKFCKEPIFPRKEPLSEKQKLYREGDLFLIEELKALKEGWWENWYSDNQGVLNARDNLANEWKTDEVKVPIADAKWRCLNMDIMEGTEKGDWGKVFNAYTSMLRQLQYEQRKDSSPLNEIVAGFMFTAYGRKQEYMGYTIGRPLFMLIEQLSTEVDQVYSLIKNTNNAKSYSKLINVTTEEIFDRYKKELNDEATLLDGFEPNERDNSTVVKINVIKKEETQNINNKNNTNSLKVFMVSIFIIGLVLYSLM